MKAVVIIFFVAFVFSCNDEKRESKYSEIEIVKDLGNNIVMTKSGLADSNNFRTFKYYDTTGRLIFIIESGGIEQRRKMFSPQLSDTGLNTILAGKYFYTEYLLNIFGPSNNFHVFIDQYLSENERTAFNVTDSIISKNYKFHLSQNEFNNLLKYLK